MGLSIFYSGRLRRPQLLPALIHETMDVCDQLHWSCNTHDPGLSPELSGMWFSPPSCDYIYLTFLDTGELITPYDLERTRALGEPVRGKCYLTDCITQFAGPDVHMQLVDFMRHLSGKYFFSFHMTDESEYWETRDAQRCHDWFQMFEAWMNTLSVQIGTLDGQGYLSGDSVYERIAELVKQGRMKELIEISSALETEGLKPPGIPF